VKGGKQSFKMAAIGFVVALVLVCAGGAVYAHTNNPTFCGGCHAMGDYYDSWLASSHQTVACSECHLPHDNIFSTLVAKTQTGVVDLYKQTTRDYDLHTNITDKGKQYLKMNCVRCHEPAVRETGMGTGKNNVGDGRDCTSCHRDLVHPRGIKFE
jgi:cytochrome c nitrite reductase small subunit